MPIIAVPSPRKPRVWQGGCVDTLEQLASRVVMPTIEGTVVDTATRRWLERDTPGGLVLFGRNVVSPQQLHALTAELAEAASRPLLLALDEEGGDVTRLHHREGSDSPGNLALGTVDDLDLTRAVAADLGRQLRAAGITLDLAPSVDVNTDPRNPVIGTRSFGSDPALVARHGVAFVRGLREAGVLSCAKHFPGHGDTNVDSHFGLPTVDGSDLETHLAPFRAVIDAGVECILTAHIVYPALDERPATLSRAIATDLLRGTLGFQGLVISDSMTMQAVSDTYGLLPAAVLAVAAGVDLLCVNATVETHTAMRDALVTAVRDGRLCEDRLAEAVGRIDTAIRREPRPAPAAPGVADVGLRAADLALIRESPSVPLQGSKSYVVELAGPRRGVDSEAGSLLAALREVDSRADGVRLRGDAASVEALERAVRDAAGRTLVVVVRDAYRDPAQQAAVERLAKGSPGLVLVGLGMPDDRKLAGPGGFLGTCGAAAVNLRAAAQTLLLP